MRFAHNRMPHRCRAGDRRPRPPPLATIAGMRSPCHDRRRLLGLLAFGAAGWATAQEPGSKHLVVGVEATLFAAGLAGRLAEVLARDTGLAIEWRPAPSGLVLPQLERGDLDAALTHEPEVEAALGRKNLIHDRRAVAATEMVLVGPAPRRASKKAPASGDPAGVAGAADGAEALRRIAAAGERGEALYVACGEPSGTRHLEQALWRAVGPLPVGAWLRTAAPGPDAALALARELQAYAIIERGLWTARGEGSGLAVLVDGDARLAATYHVMRPLRSNHPAGKLLAGWLAGPNGRRVVGRFGRGYRVPA